MNDDSQDGLDRLLGEWAASREADDQHTSRLSNQILAAVRNQPSADVGRNKSAQFRHESNVASLPERRKALVRPTSTSDADWGMKLMIGGGGLLAILILAGGVLYYNLRTVPAGGLPRTGPIVVAPSSLPRATAVANDIPAASSLGANVLAAKRQLLAETNALFDDQLAWIADGQSEVTFDVSEQEALNRGEFMLVRVVVARRKSPTAPWSTIWQTDVISRSESFVEVAPRQLDGPSLAMWTYRMPDGGVAVDMDLVLDQQTGIQSASSTVLQTGQPTRVGCSTENGIEQCVFQTVMPLHPSQI